MNIDIFRTAGLILTPALSPLSCYGSLIGLALIVSFALAWKEEQRATAAREVAMREWVAEMRRIHAHRQTPLLVEHR